jgi:hypothetical protein
MGVHMLLVPGEFGDLPAGGLVMYEACGIRWDDMDRLRFLSKCKWETMEVDGQLRRCLIWQGARSRGGANRKTGRKAGNKQWYGSFSVKGKTVRAHKFAAVALHGLRPGPDDELDHNCYNTLCVFCLECVPKVVNQARIRRGDNAQGKLSAGVLKAGRHNAHPGCTNYPLDPDAD